MIPNWMPLVNFFLLCWLAVWSFIVERRIWYIKQVAIDKMSGDIVELAKQARLNAEAIAEMRMMIRETAARVDQIVKHVEECQLKNGGENG